MLESLQSNTQHRASTFRCSGCKCTRRKRSMDATHSADFGGEACNFDHGVQTLHMNRAGEPRRCCWRKLDGLQPQEMKKSKVGVCALNCLMRPVRVRKRRPQHNLVGCCTHNCCRIEAVQVGFITALMVADAAQTSKWEAVFDCTPA
jgi:hypothetical protein